MTACANISLLLVFVKGQSVFVFPVEGNRSAFNKIM